MEEGSNINEVSRFKNPDNRIPDVEEKKELYGEAVKEIRERVQETDSFVSRMATVVAVLRNNMPHYFWCGFYFAEEENMVVGPYQGSTACPNIGYEGVCGKGASGKETLIVSNVHEFPGHIACDNRTNSEIVIPLIDKRGIVIAVLDVDSTELNAFDDVDKECLEKEIMPILLEKED